MPELLAPNVDVFGEVKSWKTLVLHFSNNFSVMASSCSMLFLRSGVNFSKILWAIFWPIWPCWWNWIQESTHQPICAMPWCIVYGICCSFLSTFTMKFESPFLLKSLTLIAINWHNFTKCNCHKKYSKWSVQRLLCFGAKSVCEIDPRA